MLYLCVAILFLGTGSYFSFPTPSESWGPAQKSSSSGLCHRVVALTCVHVTFAWALLPHVPPVRLDLPSGSTSSHELSSHTPVDDAVWTDGHHTQSQLVSQRRSQSLGPDSVSSTTSFSQGPLCGISKYLTQNLALGIILTLGNFLKLYSENCHAKKLFWLLFYDGEEVSLFCQPTSPFCTFLISMGELEFEGQFNTWSILRHSVIIVQQAWIVFKIAN